jgi:Antitoxin VbhA
MEVAGISVYNEVMQRSAVARNGSPPGGVRVSREQAVADAEGLLRAEGLEMSPEHQSLAARWVAGEVDSAQLEQLGLDLVRQRTAATAAR